MKFQKNVRMVKTPVLYFKISIQTFNFLTNSFTSLLWAQHVFYSIEIEYGWSNQFSPFSLVSMLVSAGTVLIVPGYTNEEHTMNVSIFHNGEEVEKMSYSYDTKAILALWHNSNEARKSVVGKMVGMMLDDIQRKQLIPVFDVSKQRAGVMINDF